MISSADTEPLDILPIFSSIGVRVTFLVPTKTAMQKSIIDATIPVQEYFIETGLHDYQNQNQGNNNKVQKETYFVHNESLKETTTSMYRPSTKSGDPRIWFYDLKSYAEPHNLLAIIVNENVIYVINCSDYSLMKSIESGTNPILKKLGISIDGLSPEARELLNLLSGIGKSGWVPSMRKGDTGIGYTLETLLGIPANSSKSPDFKGIEIKSSRKRSSNLTLFSKTPDWNKSHLKSSLEIVTKRGKFSEKKNRIQLNHSIHANKQNSYGLQLEMCFEENLLKQYCNIADRREDDVLWEMSVLKDALKKKHRQTFWVSSQTRITNNVEEFLFFEGAYTIGPNIDAFPLLIEAGEVFVDYVIKILPSGSAKDQGYLFKMRKKNLDALFGKPKIFSLV